MVRTLVLALAGTALLGSGIRGGVGADLTSSASAWLASLDDAQRQSALYAFDDDERFDLRLAPLFLEGLRRDGLSDPQWKAGAACSRPCSAIRDSPRSRRS